MNILGWLNLYQFFWYLSHLCWFPKGMYQYQLVVFVSFFHFSYTFAKLVLLLKIRYRNSDYFLSKILYSFFYCCVFNSIHTIWECVLILKISVIGYSFEIEIEKMSFKQTNELRLNRFSTLATGICTCHVNSYDCFIIFMSLS